ncbi:hypothetical protein ZHAS_00006498 [Anopheles sinensis]|uniref:Uncharacterized protein n=1 Tax=Anopheles sinensis TaxID=74873 RepID=A0A084VMG8_ANOSI|nr:hypothetical protein ZHAS_00006498 [Anopheles sinensis]
MGPSSDLCRRARFRARGGHSIGERSHACPCKYLGRPWSAKNERERTASQPGPRMGTKTDKTKQKTEERRAQKMSFLRTGSYDPLEPGEEGWVALEFGAGTGMPPADMALAKTRDKTLHQTLCVDVSHYLVSLKLFAISFHGVVG